MIPTNQTTNQQTKKIVLPYSGYTVFLRERLKWKALENINMHLWDSSSFEVDQNNPQMARGSSEGSKTVRWLRAKMFHVVEKMIDKEGKEVKLDNNFLDNELDGEDGEFLMAEINAILDKQKKRKQLTDQS